jgi:hypothetical protein
LASNNKFIGLVYDHLIRGHITKYLPRKMDLGTQKFKNNVNLNGRGPYKKGAELAEDSSLIQKSIHIPLPSKNINC